MPRDLGHKSAMNILVLHKNFPGQFRHIVRYLVQTGHKVVGVGNEQSPGLPGVTHVRYELKNMPKQPPQRHMATVFDAAIRSDAVAGLMRQLEKQGFTPDAVLTHPGWGEALYVKDVFPKARLVSLFEFYYHAEGADVGFEPGSQPASPDLRATLRMRNMLHLTNLELCDVAVSPTRWQKSLHPRAYHNKIAVAHEGVNTEVMTPDDAAKFTLPDGRTLTRADKVVTYVARNLEPYRGFHVFMRALPEIQRRCPGAVAVIVGGDNVSYGRPPKDAANWREAMLAEVGPRLDLSRVVFTGQIPYRDYRSLLQVSGAHAYLTYPFVLSWSMLEAMSCGCPILGSATPPVQEVLADGVNGRLFPFFEGETLAGLVQEALEKPEAFKPLREAARKTAVEGYDIRLGIARYLTLLGIPLPSATDANKER
jgi:glycosyltransferase involved in cell wall biosynthesis